MKKWKNKITNEIVEVFSFEELIQLGRAVCGITNELLLPNRFLYAGHEFTLESGETIENAIYKFKFKASCFGMIEIDSIQITDSISNDLLKSAMEFIFVTTYFKNGNFLIKSKDKSFFKFNLMDKERLELTYEIVNYETKHNLIKEKEEIDKKITNLKEYISSDKFSNLNIEAKTLIIQQNMHMSNYSECLDIRIKLFKN